MKFVIYKYYTEMHGQQNMKERILCYAIRVRPLGSEITTLCMDSRSLLNYELQYQYPSL
jgi:hypothetical protein